MMESSAIGEGDTKELEMRVASVDGVTTENFDAKVKELVDRFGDDATGLFIERSPSKTWGDVKEQIRLFEAYHVGKAVRFTPTLEMQRASVVRESSTCLTGVYVVPLPTTTQETPALQYDRAGNLWCPKCDSGPWVWVTVPAIAIEEHGMCIECLVIDGQGDYAPLLAKKGRERLAFTREHGGRLPAEVCTIDSVKNCHMCNDLGCDDHIRTTSQEAL